MIGPNNRSSSVGRDNYGIIVSGDGNSVQIPSDCVPHREFGIKSLQVGQYERALEHLRKALDETPGDAHLYFLSAVAILKGKKAFLASLVQIREAEGLLDTALALEARGIFFYFLAYLSHDYYDRKRLRPPSSADALLKMAFDLGVEGCEVDSLFRFLRVEDPFSGSVKKTR